MPPTTPEPLLSVKAVAGWLGVSSETVRRLAGAS